jgi:hypothetical protein
MPLKHVEQIGCAAPASYQAMDKPKPRRAGDSAASPELLVAFIMTPSHLTTAAGS